MKLPANQVAVLEAVSAEESRSIEEIATESGLKPEAVTGASFALAEESLVVIDEYEDTTVTVTDEGQSYLEKGLPEQRLYDTATNLSEDENGIPIADVIERAGLDKTEVSIALANFTRKDLGEITDGRVVPTPSPPVDEEAEGLRVVADGTIPKDDIRDNLKRRGLIEEHQQLNRAVTLTERGVTTLMQGIEVADTVGRVTPELLTTGHWRDVDFGEYNVAASGTPTIGGKVHILRQTANRVKEVLIGMGFKEMAGPHVDAQFWINDCLFMPQDHPARTHWDQFALERPESIRDLPEGLLERVRDVHQSGVGPDGDGYHSPWTESIARQLDLRGHTTSLSMRYLSGDAIGPLEPPERYFSVEKVYRNDTLDPTHLLEFFQIEGWVMADGLSVRDLMGTFTEFYAHFGITDLQFKPHYNPYTEPSFELFGHHPETGELIEIGNSGMFRPEVLEPLGVECEVMAWGLALERLLMLMYGFEDIRDVHGTLCDIQLLRDTAVIS